jgi:hypothetical protein
MNFSRRSRRVLVIIALVFGLAGAQLIIRALTPGNIYRKDFIQEYLLAKAIFAGVDPYLSLPELARKVGVALPYPILPHPTPHPPPVALLCLPLAQFSYEYAALIWLLIEVACLFASVALLWRSWGSKPSLPQLLLVGWAALGWAHVWAGLVLGQVNTILLLLFTIAWLKLRNGHPGGDPVVGQMVGGAALGCALALKFVGWPLVIFLALRRKWRSALAAAATWLALNLAAAALMGWQSYLGYYTRTGPLLYYYYRANCGNLSLWSIGWRLFSGTESPALISIESPPLFYAPGLAKLISIALPLALLIFSLRSALRMKSFDAAYGLMICVSVLVSPVMWAHYITMAAIPMLIAARALAEMNFPRRQTVIAAVLILSLSLPYSILANVMTFFLIERTPDGPEVVTFAAGLLSLIPTVALVAWIWLLRAVERSTTKLLAATGVL